MKRHEFEEKFEIDDNIGGTDAYLLSSHGCFQRHNTPVNDQYLTMHETITKEMSYRSHEEWSDQRVINAVDQLHRMGIHDIGAEETLEHFVRRHEVKLCWD